jgi:HAD superfamily hydrolase (TIGR01484 family)
MKPWGEAKKDQRVQKCSVIGFDLDDTLTTHGQLEAPTLDLLTQLGKNKWKRVLVTGRPSGWADALMKLLPVDAVVAEQGAHIQFWAQPRSRGLAPVRHYWTKQGYQSHYVSPHDPQTVQKLWDEVRRRFPQLKAASDQPYRLYDQAVDFAEEVTPPLSFREADEIRKIFESLGATAKVSSIHVNGWWGDFTKAQGLEFLVEKCWGLKVKNDVIFVGDSPNDASLFERAAVSVGVANICEFRELPFERPHYVTQEREGAGACEVMRALL